MTGGGELRKAVRVHGRVQGVGFRWWAQEQGRRLGLRGTVRNCTDGSVEVVIAGEVDAVSEMLKRLEEGPSASRVIRVEELNPPGEVPDEFRIAF
jgi:acylphosphatase